MIKRVFRAEVVADLREEFEDKFANFARPEVLSFEGCVGVQIFKPATADSTEYLMISDWESTEALEKQFGSQWQQAYIPDVMRKFFVSYSLSHHEDWWQGAE